MSFARFVALAIICSAVLVGCSITRTVRPIENASISELCIQENKDVLMDGFLPELQSQIQSHGIMTRVFQGPPPADCKHHLEYVANWRWDLAMYLSFAELRVYENKNLIGQAIYDARSGGASFDKFGSTSEKLKSLTDELFAQHRATKT